MVRVLACDVRGVSSILSTFSSIFYYDFEVSSISFFSFVCR